MSICRLCFRHCDIPESGTGFCGARTCREGSIEPANYGRITSMALDPIEKKPLRDFHPGSMILSVGSYGCNLRCPFCQNHGISWSQETMALAERAEYMSAGELVDTAVKLKDRGNVGIAFTYNEPLIGYEYVRDAASLAHENGLLNAMVTNGSAELWVLEELLPHIDAMNIDLKGFSERYYREVLGGDLEQVKAFIERASTDCHVELTCLIVPGENDSEEEMREMSRWIAGLNNGEGRKIPLHISRFFPAFNMRDREATDPALIYRLVDIAGEELDKVYSGNC